jgi:hypothetical protein
LVGMLTPAIRANLFTPAPQVPRKTNPISTLMIFRNAQNQRTR